MSNQPYNNDHENENTLSQPEEASESNHSKEELDAIEYITPITHSKHKKHRYSKGKHHASKSNLSEEEKADMTEDFVFAQPHKKKKKSKKKMKTWVKVLLIILIVLLSIIALLFGTWFTLHQIGKSQMFNYYDNMVIKPSPEITDINKIENDGKTITYKNQKYEFNKDIVTVVLMGVDKKNLGTVDGMVGTGGQADAIYIAVIDTKSKKVSLVGVSRDSMVDVNVYNTSGGFINTEQMQLCLSYAYGDGEKTSAENTVTSLERLFFGMEFNTYFAMDYAALEKLNDAIGGVTVKTDTDFKSSYYGRTIYAGETVTLHGKDAEAYIRARDLNELESNNARMNRQKQYMTAFMQQVIPSAKKDISVVTDLFNIVKDNSTSNLTVPKVTYLATTALTNLNSYKDVNFYNVEGTIKKGEKHAEFYVDQNALMQLMLDLFYIKVS